MPDRTPELRAVLAEAGRWGVLGEDPAAALDHARRFAPVLRPARRVIDLGSGAGLPGLVLAADEVVPEVVLLDASQRRADLLLRAVHRLRLADRVEVVCERAELYGRRPEHRGSFDAVVARAFGPPSMVAECAAPLLRLGGQLVVSEPPSGRARWPAESLAILGLQPDEPFPPGFASLTQVAPCPDRFPRRKLRPLLFG